MPTYYVSPTGDDLADGSINSPWKHPDISSLRITSGDVLIVKGTDAKTPLRGTFSLSVNSSLQANTTNVPEWVSSGIDVSVGATYRRPFGAQLGNDRNLLFQNWVSGTDATTWTDSPGGSGSAITQETSLQLWGVACSKHVVNASGTDNRQYIQGLKLPANQTVTVNVIHKDSTDNAMLVRIRDQTDTYYLQADGSWAVGIYNFTVTNSTSWAAFPVSFTTRNTGDYTVDLYSVDADAVHYVQGILLDIAVSWSVYSGTVYQLPFWHSAVSGTPGLGLFKCTAAEWDADGIEALQHPVKAASLGAIAAGQYYWDGTAKVMYYMLADGEVLADLHLEMGVVDNTLYCTAATVSTYDIIAACSRFEVINNALGVTATHVRARATKGNRYGGVDDGTTTPCTVRWIDCEFDYNNDSVYETNASNGYLCANGATSTLIGCVSHHNGDDGFQKYGNGCTLKMYGCLAYANMSQQFTNTAGTGGTCEVVGCTFVASPYPGKTTDPAAQVLYDKTVAETSIYKGNIIVLNRTVNAGVKVALCDTPAQLTCSNNCVVDLTGGGAASTAVFTATDSLTSDPLFVDADLNDYTLGTDSPCIGAGPTRFWTSTAARPTGANGEPFPDFDLDIGACPTAVGMFYPK